MLRHDTMHRPINFNYNLISINNNNNNKYVAPFIYTMQYLLYAAVFIYLYSNIYISVATLIYP